jgi:putative PEP-CTERM system TPR-repeat lipoprotein
MSCASHPSRWLWTLPLALAAALLTGCGAGPSAEELLARAREFRDRSEIPAALIEAKNAVREAPERADARLLLAELYLETGDGASAEKELRKAAELGVDAGAVKVKLARAVYLQGRYQELVDEAVREAAAGEGSSGLTPVQEAELAALRGHAYLGLGRLDPAELLYDRALALRADEPEALVGKARVAVARGQPEQARPHLQAATAAAPDLATAWEALGDLEWLERNGEAAEKAYSEAIQQNPYGAALHQKRASLRMTRGDLEGAEEDVKAMARLAPRSPVVSYTRGLLRLRQARYEEAQKDFEAALKAAPNSLRTIFYLGAAYFAQGGLEQAEQHLERFFAANPQSDPAASLLAVIALRQGNQERAATLLQAVERRHPEDALTLGLLAKVRLAQGRTREAIGYLERAVAQSPEGPDAETVLALSHVATGRTEEGLAELEDIAGLDSGIERADVLLIVTYLKVGEHAKAVAAAQALQAREPKSPLPLVLLGVAESARGDLAAARGAYEKALELAPGNPSAAHNLAAILRAQGDEARARTLYEEVLAHHPDHLRTLLKLAELEAARGDPAGVERWLTRAREKYPEAVDPRFILARHYLALGKPSDALQATRGLPPAAAEDPRILLVVGEAQIASNQPASAAETLERLIAKAPSAQSHYLLAQAYAGSSRGDRVRSQLGEALKLDPGHVLAKVALTRLSVQEKKWAEVDGLIGELEAARPDDPEVTALKGLAAQARGQPEEAVALYRAAYERAPGQALLLELARAEVGAGRPDAAVATLQGWVGQHPEDSDVRGALASVYLGLGRNDDALAEFQRLAKQAPDNASVLNNLAWLLRQRDPALALKHAERAAQLAPNAPAILDTLALVLLDRGETERALRLLRQASQRAPQDPGIGYHLALALARSGDAAGAREVLRGVLGPGRPFAERGEAEALLRSLGE